MVLILSGMRSERFLFLSGGLTVFDSFLARVRRTSANVRERPRRVRLGVTVGRCNSACLERVSACVCMDVSRGRRGEWWLMRVSRGWRTCISRGRRGTPDACRRLGGRWRVDPRGKRGELARLDLAQRAFRVAGVGSGCHRRWRERGFAWQAWGIVHAPCASHGKLGAWCDLVAGHRFVWQAQGIVRAS